MRGLLRVLSAREQDRRRPGAAAGGRGRRRPRPGRRTRRPAGRPAPRAAASRRTARTRPRSGPRCVTIVARAGRGQRVAPLVGRLQDARPDRVGDDERDQREQPHPAVADELGGDVAVGEQQAGRQPERRGPAEAGRYGDQQRRAGAAGREPDDDADRRGMLIGLRRCRPATARAAPARRWPGRRRPARAGPAGTGGRAPSRTPGRRRRTPPRPAPARAAPAAGPPRTSASPRSRPRTRSSQRRSRSSTWTDRNGRRGDSGGSARRRVVLERIGRVGDQLLKRTRASGLSRRAASCERYHQAGPAPGMGAAGPAGPGG